MEEKIQQLNEALYEVLKDSSIDCMEKYRIATMFNEKIRHLAFGDMDS